MTPFATLDTLLIAPFRLLASPEAGFLFGILTIALGSAALGLAGKALVSRAQRTRRNAQEAEADKRSALSVQALQVNDKKAYLAQNHLAQEAYGNTLALSAGRGAALLWPGAASLTWLSWRFDGVPLPYLWDSAGPTTYFLPVYILALVALSRPWRKKNAAPPTHGDAAP